MRASRLVSILLLLQTRGRVTAAQLAAELEVSVRTVYRDVEALHAAGIPLYGDAGHRGGYQLLDGYRTRLTGLSPGEAEALFLSGLPGPAAELGLGSVLAAAQLKVRAALPAALAAQAERTQSRFHLDAPGWYADRDETPFLAEVADAVWHSRVLHVRYRRWKAPTEVERRWEPYGLVLKAGRWYVVAGPGPYAYRVDQILAVLPPEDGPGAGAPGAFTPPAEFDLAAWWERHQAEFHRSLHRADATVRLAPAALGRFTGPTARALAATGRVEPDGWTRAVLPIESVERACAEYLALGPEIEVLEPPELREALVRAARAVLTRYGET
ncbi:transcriptional regulator [Kitasatospora sp. MMS16-BH015]|uniref:helix-turn-helix transcriptional regulator n=1 Tax=Kitasatospora sp. MMS16-BH015 TaxID=2018025 RepID=UPI000CA1C849|nr:WYL domain-containing protein [Kitasatospora sp. MMS16-BH015]AUG75428.1 transcriptional regulator [Kitasatospora sp. MMS16-BH015]